MAAREAGPVKWALAAGLALLFAIAMPFAIGAAKRSAKGRMAGAGMAIWLAFAMAFDPAKAAAIETIQKKKEIGDSQAGESGEPID